MRTCSPLETAEAGLGSLDGGPDGVAYRLTIFIRETDHYRHRPLYAEIVHRARKAGLAGASAFRGVLGFSAPDYPQGRRWSLFSHLRVGLSRTATNAAPSPVRYKARAKAVVLGQPRPLDAALRGSIPPTNRQQMIKKA